MKKNFISMFLLMFAMLISQNMVAQDSEVIFEEKFAGSFGEFTVEGYNGENNDIWVTDIDCVKADAFRKIGDSEKLENYLVSPQVKLGEENYVVSFEHACDYFHEMKEEVSFAVREVGGTWTEIKISKFWSGMMAVADKMPIPAEFKGKTVEFGFKYTSPGSLSSGIWRIKNFKVSVASGKSEDKSDPLIGFGVIELLYDLSDPNEFASPKLYNPYNLPVTYSSDNEEVATIDQDGKVTIVAVGIVNFTATTPETEIFRAGKASYTLNVTDDHKDDPVLKDPELSFDVTEVEYDIMSGVPFEAPVLNNPHNVQVDYYSDYPDVASVDKYSGEVTIHSVGTTVISVLSWDDEEYYGGFAKYTINVSDNSIIYVGKDFGENKLNGFTEEGEGAGKLIWMPTIYGGWIQACGYKRVDKETATYMVSPEIKLDLGGNTLSFIHTGFQFADIDDMCNHATVHIREVGGEWQLFEIPYPFADFEEVSVDRMEIPAEFNGKTIQIGFKYVCDGSLETSGTWSVKDIYVRRSHLKPSADIAFAAETVMYDMNSGDAFAAPEFINPDNAEVTFASSDEEVATVDAFTGEVTIKGDGTTVISATSAEDENHIATTVSYTLTVTGATGINAVISAGEDAEIYDLQGRKVNKAEKGVYIVNGKKVTIR